MDPQIFIERILETANLTDNLEDAEADQLLRWGVAQIPALLDGVADEETAGERVSALMAFMRHINRTLGDRSNLTLAELAAALEKLAGRYRRAFDTARSRSPEEYLAAARQLQEISPQEAVAFLIALAAPHDAGAIP